MFQDISNKDYQLMLSAHGILNEDSSDSDDSYDEKYLETYNKLKPPPINIEEYSQFIAQPDKKIVNIVDINDNITSNKKALTKSFADVLKSCDKKNVIETNNNLNNNATIDDIFDNNIIVDINSTEIKNDFLFEKENNEELHIEHLEPTDTDSKCNIKDLDLDLSVDYKNALAKKKINRKIKSVKSIEGLEQEFYDLYFDQWSDEILNELKSDDNSNKLTNNNEQIKIVQPEVVPTLKLNKKPKSVKNSSISNQVITNKKPNKILKTRNKKRKDLLLRTSDETEVVPTKIVKCMESIDEEITNLQTNSYNKSVTLTVNYNEEYQEFDYGAIDKLKRRKNVRNNLRSIKVEEHHEKMSIIRIFFKILVYITLMYFIFKYLISNFYI